jgi:hypothetical protein
MLLQSDLNNRFNHHPPATQKIGSQHQLIRQDCLELANSLNRICPDSREKSLAITKLEEVMFWANSALARNPQ